VLETADDEGHRDDPWFTLRVTPTLLHHLSGRDLAIPDLRTPIDLAIAERAAALFPPLGDERMGGPVRTGAERNRRPDIFSRGAADCRSSRLNRAFRVNLATARQHSPARCARLLACGIAPGSRIATWPALRTA
jgi:hypothetical protein